MTELNKLRLELKHERETNRYLRSKLNGLIKVIHSVKSELSDAVQNKDEQ